MDTLSISTERPILEITSRAAKLNIRSHRPRMMIRRARPVMRVDRKMPTFKSNWAKIQELSGRPSVLEKSRQQAEEAYQVTLSAIADIATKGNRLMRIDKGHNTIAQIAGERLFQSRAVDINIGLTPRERAQMEWDPGHLHIEWSDPILDFDWDVSPSPEITVEPHAVEVRLRNRPGVRISVNKRAAAKQVGGKVDRRI